MSALPRPDLPPGSQRDLNDALHELHHRAGWPSLRVLARRAGCSHTTVSAVLSGPKLPSWGLLELLVEAMGGEPAAFHTLWLAAGRPPGDEFAGSARIAGRRTELATIRRHLQSGVGLIILAGEAGIGKTTLLDAAPAGTNVFVARGAGLPLSRAGPLLPVAGALRDLHRREQQWLEDAVDAAPSYVRDSLGVLVPELGRPLETPAIEAVWARHRLFTAIGVAFAELAAKRPLAICWEDLHWADLDTLELLERLLGQDVPCPLVASYRLEDPTVPEPTSDWFQRLRRLPTVQVVELGPLNLAETADQLTMLRGSAADLEAIYSRSQGQPLFTEQLAAHAPGAGRALPGILGELLDRRLEGLHGIAWSMVRMLAVAGRELDVGLLADATGATPAGLAAPLRDLMRRSLLTTGNADGPDGGELVRLRHPLLAEAVRRRMMPGEAAEPHRRLAELLAARPESSPAEVAGHWQAAHLAAQELHWRVRAAREADARLAGDEAAVQWERVLELWPPGTAAVGDPPADRPQAWLAAIDASQLAGTSGRSLRLAERALHEAPTWIPYQQAELYLRIGRVQSQHETQPLAGHAMIDRAIATYRRLPPSEGLVHALDLKAMLLSETDHDEEVVALLQEASTVLDRIGDSPLRRGLSATIAWQHTQRGDIERAVREISEVARLEPARPEPERDIWIGVTHTDILLMACRPAEEVARAAERGLRAARAWGIESTLSSYLFINVAIAWLREGRPDRCTQLLDTQVGTAAPAGGIDVDVLRTHLQCLSGELQEARRSLHASLTRRLGDTSMETQLPAVAVASATIDLWDQQPSSAFRTLDEVFRHRFRLLLRGQAGEVLTLAARAGADLVAPMTAGPESARGREVVERLAAMHSGLGHDPFAADALPADKVYSPTWSAELARLHGADTVDQWGAAAAAWDSVGWPFDAAYCRWRAARLATRDGRRTAATALLRRAAHDARGHGPLTAALQTTATPA